MRIIGHKLTARITEGATRVVAGAPDIALGGRVVLLLKQLAGGTVIASLGLTIAEARELAHELLQKADEAERSINANAN